MATVSFKEDLVLQDTKKISEIAKAMQEPRRTEIKAAQPPKLPNQAGKIWFKHSEN